FWLRKSQWAGLSSETTTARPARTGRPASVPPAFIRSSKIDSRVVLPAGTFSKWVYKVLNSADTLRRKVCGGFVSNPLQLQHLRRSARPPPPPQVSATVRAP